MGYDGEMVRMEELKVLYDNILGKPWKMWQGSIIVAVLTIGLFLVKAPWTTVGFVIIGQHFYHFLGLSLSASTPPKIDLLSSEYAMLWLMMLWGAFGSSLLSKEFAVRVPPKGEMVRGFVGGLFMGIGFMIGVGCTAGAFFNGWPAMSAGALMFGLGLLLGAIMGVKYNVWEMMRFPNFTSGRSHTYLAAKRAGTSYQPLAGFIVLIVGASIAFIYDPGAQKSLVGFVLIGLLIGVALQKSGFCITRAFREPILTGDTEATEAIIGGMIVALFGFAVIKGMGIRDEMTFVEAAFWVPGLLGGTIFGFGMLMNGGCTVGSVRGAGDGFVKFWFAIAGMIISAPLTAEYIVPALNGVLPANFRASVYLPDYFTYPGAVGLILLIFFLWYIIVKWNARTGKFSLF